MWVKLLHYFKLLSNIKLIILFFLIKYRKITFKQCYVKILFHFKYTLDKLKIFFD